MDELEVTLNTKANRSDLDIALSLTGEQADALNVLLGTKANQSDVDAELALKANQTDGIVVGRYSKRSSERSRCEDEMYAVVAMNIGRTFGLHYLNPTESI